MGLGRFLPVRRMVSRLLPQPENILMSTDGSMCKLADLGLSINYEEERPVTRLGTLEYM